MVPLDVAGLVGVGGSTSIIGGIIAILIKSYFDARKDQREQQASDVQTDSGIVDNAQKVVNLVRGESDRMAAQIDKLIARAEQAEAHSRSLEQIINAHEDTIARQNRALEWLREDLGKAQQEIARLNERLS